MSVLLTGMGILAAAWLLFWAKDRFDSPRLARAAYHELTARLVIVGYGLVVVGGVMTAADLLGI